MNPAPIAFSTTLSQADEGPVRKSSVLGNGGWPVAILGIPFDHVTSSQALARMEQMIASRQPHYIVTANIDFLVQAMADVELRRILVEAHLVLCDGAPLVWASRLLGNPLPERVAGADIVPPLFARAEQRGHRVFLLGAAEGVAKAAADALLVQYPALKIAGYYSPPYRRLLEMDHDEIVRQIRAAQPDILLVGFGCPKQEKWLAMHYRTLGVPVALGIGGTLDYAAGRVKRAPGWMRQTGLEWMFRLSQEPRRLFRRYATDVVRFFPAFFQEWRAFRPARRASSEERPVAFTAGDRIRVWAGPAFTVRHLDAHQRFWRDALAHRDCVLDLSQVQVIDSTAIALLACWQRDAVVQERRLVLFAPSEAVRNALARGHLLELFQVAENLDDLSQLTRRESEPSPVTVLPDLVHTVAWQHEVTAANAEKVWQLTQQHLRAAAAGTRVLVIDLSRLRFIDSTGVGLMLRVRKWARDLAMDVAFVGAQPDVRNVLQLAQLHQILLQDHP